MRKLALVVLCIAAFVVVHAQKIDVSGKVTGTDGSPVSGASVTEKGTKNGVVAGVDGSFKISVNKGAKLIITALGFATSEVNASGNVAVKLQTSAASDLNEVVVTAQGVRRRPKELGTSIAKLSPSDLTVGRSPQLAQSLAGKVSGLTVFNVNNSVDPAVKITLRGYRSITGSNDALIVVDGIPMPPTGAAGSSSILNILNPNDIESVTILKGGQSATLYGSAGVNGAVVITTKKGTKGAKPRVTFSNATNFEEISFMPEFQTQYGSGSHYAASFGATGYKPNYLDRMKDNWRSFENQQFGDAFNGEQRIIGRVLEDGSKNILPYSNIDGERKRIWNKGVTTNNQLAVSGGNDLSTYYLSIENNLAAGVVPSDNARRTGVRVGAATDAGKLHAGFNVNYVQANYDRTTFDFYNEMINQAGNIPLSQYRDWRNNKFANPNGWYNDYYNNPYFQLDNNRTKYGDANFNGNVELSFKVNNWLNIYNKAGVINNVRNQKSTTGKFNYSSWAKSSAYVPDPWAWSNDYNGISRAGTDIPGGVSDVSSSDNILNNEFQIQANHDYGDFSLKGLVGFSLYERKTKQISVSSGSIVVPDVYNVANRQGELGGGEANTLQRKYGYYADLLTGYKDMIFVHGSFRYDATSLFYKNNRATSMYAYPYYGFDVSAILTEIFPSIKGKVLNYAKLRASYNKTGNDNIDLYGLDATYPNGTNFPYGNVVGITVGGTLPDKDLKPEFVTSYEAGGEFQLFDNRLNIDVTAYKQKSTGQVINATVSQTTGFGAVRINIGTTENWGYEADVKYQVIRSKNVDFGLKLNYSYNQNKITSLYQNLKDFAYGGFTYAASYAVLDKSFPQLRAISYVRDPATNRVVVNSTTGYPLTSGAFRDFGRSTPPHQFGFGTNLRVSDFTLTANLEYRGGNYVYSDLGRQMTFTGSGGWTSDRTPHIFPNSAYDDGTGKFVPNTTVNVRESEYSLWVDYYRLISENFIYPGWFIKMRDVNLSYAVPQKLVSKTKIFSNIGIAIYGRNLFTIVDKANDFTDPEYSFTTGNGQGINTTAQTPPVRQYGFNVNLTFK